MLKKIIITSCVLVLSIVSNMTYAQNNAFTPLVDFKPLFNKKSKNVWKPIPERESFLFHHDDEFYVIAGKRADGYIAFIYKSPGLTDPKKTTYIGFYFKCGKLVDTPFYFEDEKSLQQEMNKPSVDNPAFKMKFDKTMGVYDYYTLACDAQGNKK